MSGKEEIISSMKQFEHLHEKYLPKVDRHMVIDLLLRLRENPGVKPMYTVETWVEEGGDIEAIRSQVIRMTGTVPQIFDRGSHLVASHRLDYELLKEIQDHPKVLEVKGTFLGSNASMGAALESSADIAKGQR